MGKPYLSELAKLAAVYEWAVRYDVTSIAKAVGSLAASPLLAIGSGGSLTAAYFAAYLHQHLARRPATVLTPLEIVALPPLTDTGVLVLSAGGRNPDVLGTLRVLACREPSELVLVCATEGSLLSEAAADYEYVQRVEFSPPTGKDGFVATNSLLATAVLMVRAYERIYPSQETLPPALDGLFRSGTVPEAILENAAWRPVLSREHLLVLFGSTGRAAAIDLESKCSEAALTAVQLSDFRNFAHGRHHWLSTKPHDTGVVAIITDEDEALASRTLALLPGKIPAMTLRIPNSGAHAALGAIVAALHLVGAIGKVKGIDPGRPRVATFGRKLYHLNAFRLTDHRVRPPGTRTMAIQRKAGIPIDKLRERDQLDHWNTGLDTFLNRLSSAAFSAIVFDYDGTLCASRKRSEGLQPDIVKRLRNLVKHGLLLGIATGRGASVRQDLRDKLPRTFWDRIWVGYYNGGQIGVLAADSVPDRDRPAPEELQNITARLLQHRALHDLIEAEPDLRSSQITVFPKDGAESRVWDILQHFCAALDQPLVRSSHSMDILARGVSKLNLVAAVTDEAAKRGGVSLLRIGDLGLWPGNDYQLLGHEFGLSVDQVSSDPETCWNLAPAGHRGPQATLDYLGAIEFAASTARINLSMLGLDPPL